MILADIAEMDEPPGTIRLVRPGELAGGGASTRDPGLHMTLAYLRAQHDFDAWLLGVQPACLDFDAPLSAPVGKALESLAEVFTSEPQAVRH